MGEKMRNHEADAAAVPLTDAELSSSDSLARLRELVAGWRHALDAAMSLEQIAERSMGIVTAYLAGELPPAVATEVEDILRTEPLLRAAHAKLFAAWQAPNAERAVSDDAVDAAYGRFKAMRAAKFGGNGPGPSDV
jgi:hypothetical protein